MPAIRPRAIPGRSDEGACNDRDRERRLRTQGAAASVESLRQQTTLSRPHPGGCIPQRRGQPRNAPRENRTPGPQEPSHRAHRRVEETDEAWFDADSIAFVTSGRWGKSVPFAPPNTPLRSMPPAVTRAARGGEAVSRTGEGDCFAAKGCVYPETWRCVVLTLNVVKGKNLYR